MLVVEASVRLLPHHHVLTSRFDSGHCFRPVIVRLDQVECLFEYLFTLCNTIFLHYYWGVRRKFDSCLRHQSIKRPVFSRAFFMGRVWPVQGAKVT